ncbi:MAG: ATP-binding protein [Polyangiales bacterium]
MHGTINGSGSDAGPATGLGAASYVTMQDTRERALHVTLSWLSWAMFPIAMMLAVQSYLDGVSWQPAIAIGMIAVPIIGLRLASKRLGYELTAKALIAQMFLAALYSEIMYGVTSGAVLVNAAMIALCGLLFGDHTTRWALVACIAAIFIAGATHVTGVRVSDASAFFDPTRPVVWFRYAVTFAVLGGAVTVGVSTMLRTLQRAVDELRASLDRERAERAQREAAQRSLERHERLDLLAQLAGGMAHDFNNTLMVVMSGVELISLDRQASPTVRRLAGDILTTTKASALTVKRTLALGKQATGVTQDVDVAELVSWVQKAAAHLLPKTIAFTLDLHAKCAVRIDAARMQQALLNLCINARDAMPAGGAITIRAERREVDGVPPGWTATAGPYVALSVVDSGSGMDAQTIARIFEPFFTTKPIDQGTGLGLPMVRAAVQDVGGFLEVRSELGAGTCFTVYLPCLQDAAYAEPVREPVEPLVPVRRAL